MNQRNQLNQFSATRLEMLDCKTLYLHSSVGASRSLRLREFDTNRHEQ